MSAQLEDLNAKVTDAMRALTAAAKAGPYSDELQSALDDIILSMQQIQNDMVEETEEEVINNLKAQNNDLAELNKKIDDYSKKLDATAQAIKKISDAVATIVTVVTVIASL